MDDQEIRQRLNRIDDDVAEAHNDALHNKEMIIEHEVRFKNGIQVMGELKQGIQSLQPKAPDWQKLFLAGLAAVGILMGAQIYIQDRFNDRPTTEQVDNRIRPIRSTQKETSKEISDIEKHQSAQQTSIRNIENTQAVQGKKLDNILDRLSKRRRGR